MYVSGILLVTTFSLVCFCLIFLFLKNYPVYQRIQHNPKEHYNINHPRIYFCVCVCFHDNHF